MEWLEFRKVAGFFRSKRGLQRAMWANPGVEAPIEESTVIPVMMSVQEVYHIYQNLIKVNRM